VTEAMTITVGEPNWSPRGRAEPRSTADRGLALLALRPL